MRALFLPAGRLMRAAASKWKADRADTMAAALAYYSCFSLAPLVMLGVAASSLRASGPESQRFMVGLVEAVVGSRAADAVRPVIESGSRMKHGGWATAFGIVTLLYAASTLFVHLQSALNVIWDVPPRRHGWLQDWVRGYLKRRVVSAALVTVVPLVLLFGPVWSAWIRSLGHSQLVTVMLSLSFETALFGFIFKVLPDVSVAWEDAWVGAVFTASFFTLCQTLLGYYLNRVASRSAYGAAGSLLALLIWIHVSAQILLFGAEFIQVYKKERTKIT